MKGLQRLQRPYERNGTDDFWNGQIYYGRLHGHLSAQGKKPKKQYAIVQIIISLPN